VSAPATRNLAESERLLAVAAGLVPAWTQTLSKNPTQWMRGVAPAYVARAEGAYVWDVDGNRYIDYPMALGPIILGHAHPAVNAAVARQLQDGVAFTLPHPIELDVAQMIVDRAPGAEMVRFGKTGSDATSAAVRLARAVTGREHVIAGGYHGWHDWFIGSTSRHLGVPRAVRELIDTFAFNDLASLDAALAAQAGDTAAVILEPAAGSEPEPGFLQGVVDRAHAAGALVIFDEIVTGFRLGRGGAQERYGVTADIATFGKALANGLPLSAIAGREELMRVFEDVFFSGTHGGEALSLAAARATLEVLDDAAYARLAATGERLRTGIQGAIDSAGVGEVIRITGPAERTQVFVAEPADASGELLAKSLVQQELVKRGVLFNGANLVSLAHSDDDIDETVAAFGDAFARLADGWGDGAAGLRPLLEGEPLQPAFRTVS
jgi:glutamate-1-semialdehyde aminotransferase